MLQMHKNRGDSQGMDAEATRPESRRAHKPAAVRAANDPALEAGSLQEATHHASSAAEQQSHPSSDNPAAQPQANIARMASKASSPEVSAAAGYQDALLEQPLGGDFQGHSLKLHGQQVAPASGSAAPGPSGGSNDPQLGAQHQGLASTVASMQLDAEGKMPAPFRGPSTGTDAPSMPASAAPQPAPQRPMTAKKAPPLKSWPAPTTQRGRLRPPTDSISLGARQGVHVYHEDAALDDDAIDVVQAAPVVVQQAQQQNCGILVNEMNKAKDSAEASQGMPSGEAETPVDSGINLGRSKRTKKRTTARVETSLVRDNVETLVQSIASLAGSMDYLQVGKDSYYRCHRLRSGRSAVGPRIPPCRRIKKTCRKSFKCGAQRAQCGVSGCQRKCPRRKLMTLLNSTLSMRKSPRNRHRSRH